MTDRVRVKLTGKPFGDSSTLPWINLRFEDMETGRIIPIARDHIVLKYKDGAVVAEVSLLIHTVEIEDPCLEGIGDEIVMIPEGTAERLATVNGVLVCRCHRMKEGDSLIVPRQTLQGVDKPNQ